MTRFHLEMNKTSKLCINKTISIVNFILLSFLYSNRRIGCKIPGRVTKVSKYIMMVNFKQYTYIIIGQLNLWARLYMYLQLYVDGLHNIIRPLSSFYYIGHTDI